MDPRESPYTPGAGTHPALIAGRERELDRFSVLVDRLARRRSAEAVLFAGSRGMGKTVLLRECERRCRAAGWFTAFEEVDPSLPLRQVMALNARDVIYQMRASKRYGDRIKRALGVLKAFTSIGILGVSFSIDAELIPGTADSGVFKRDLLALFTELGEIAASDSAGVVFLLDELHTLRESEEMAVLNAVIHGMAQQALPVTAVGAGVFPGPGYTDPDDPESISTYAGRLYRVVRLQPLSRESSSRAITEPASEVGVTYDPVALELAIAFAGGLPYFVQLIGEEAWEQATSSTQITEADVRAAIDRVHARLDGDFYPRLLRGIDDEDMQILAAFAGMGGVGVSPESVATRTGKSQHLVNAAIRQLRRRDVVAVAFDRERRYSFVVPGVADYLGRSGNLAR